MRTVRKWILIGFAELIFCFWLLDQAASLVSSPNNFQVWLGVLGYLFGLIILPGFSAIHVTQKINDARVKQKQLRQAFTDDETSLWQLLDMRR